MEVYCGHRSVGTHHVDNRPSEVVKQLITLVFESSQSVVIDNWFMSYKLVDKLKWNQNLLITGTHQRNKRFIPTLFAELPSYIRGQWFLVLGNSDLAVLKYCFSFPVFLLGIYLGYSAIKWGWAAYNRHFLNVSVQVSLLVMYVCAVWITVCFGSIFGHRSPFIELEYKGFSLISFVDRPLLGDGLIGYIF